MIKDLGICLVAILVLFAVMFLVIWWIDVVKNKKVAIAVIMLLSLAGIILGMVGYAKTQETWMWLAGAFFVFPLSYAGEESNKL